MSKPRYRIEGRLMIGDECFARKLIGRTYTDRAKAEAWISKGKTAIDERNEIMSRELGQRFEVEIVEV